MMNDEQKAMHDYALHQDQLYWSRIPFLIAVQSGVLTGTYYLGSPPKPELFAATILTILGVVLTGAILLIMERDLSEATTAFDKSGAHERSTNAPSWRKGRVINRIVVGILVGADIALLLYLVIRS